jgi:Divergent InlB B-repeat domain/Cysteine-rich secretory protein family
MRMIGTILCILTLLSYLNDGAFPSSAVAGAVPETGTSPFPVISYPAVTELGRYPEGPDQRSALLRLLPQATVPATGIAVDTSSREQSRNFYNAIYPASDGVPMGWSGDMATCSPGTSLPGFREAVLLRINYYRAMAGVPAAITFSDVYSGKSQQAALMMSRNNALNYKPPTTWSCYTADGYEAAGKSNLTLGVSGVAAIPGYVMDYGTGNSAVGHRRRLLYPQTRFMGSGDIPAVGVYSAANSLWFFDDNYGSSRPTTRDEFVAWPPPGFVPYQTVFPRWSLSYPGADFSGAGVTMSRNGVTLAVRLEPIVANVGENTLVWVPDNLDTSVAKSFSRPDVDTSYTVAVTNVIIGGTPRSFTYTVILFDPQSAGVDHVSAVVTGLTSPSVGFAASYAISPVPGADGYQWRSGVVTLFSGSYGAENGLDGITPTLSSGYSPVSSGISASGAFSYHMAHPGTATVNPTDQLLTLDRSFLVGAFSKLTFQSRLGWASVNQKGVVELSSDGGVTWQQIFLQAGSGTAGETLFTPRSLDLSSYTGQVVTIRFAYRLTTGQYSYYPQTDPGVGWYLDDITLVSVGEVTGITTSSVISSTSFDVTPQAAGDVILQSRPFLYGQYPLEWGPVLRLTAQAPSQLSLTLSGTGNGMVTSIPAGLSCPLGSCSQLFPTGLPVLLMATPDTNSLFKMWSGGGCGGTDSCTVNMATATGVTAWFDYVQPVRVPMAIPAEFPSLLLAYGAATDGGSILARSFTFTENLLLDQNKRVFLMGGYNNKFVAVSGVSVIAGHLAISSGSLVVSGITIK